jgi:hypothetical protein
MLFHEMSSREANNGMDYVCHDKNFANQSV